MNFSILVKCLYFLIATDTVLSKRVFKPDDLGRFCEVYPLHKKCMGVFAGGGKRTFNDNMDFIKDKIGKKDLSSKQKKILEMLMLYKDIQLLSKLLILNDFKKENENDKDDEDSVINKQKNEKIKENEMSNDKKINPDYEDTNEEFYDYDIDANNQNDSKPKLKLYRLLEKLLKEEK